MVTDLRCRGASGGPSPAVCWLCIWRSCHFQTPLYLSQNKTLIGPPRGVAVAAQHTGILKRQSLLRLLYKVEGIYYMIS